MDEKGRERWTSHCYRAGLLRSAENDGPLHMRGDVAGLVRLDVCPLDL